MTSEELATTSEALIIYMTEKYPMEMYERGALLMSIGSFLVASAIPELWPDLKNTAILAHQLLDQAKMQDKMNDLAQKTESKIITPDNKIITL